jgi:hypothetical protein
MRRKKVSADSPQLAVEEFHRSKDANGHRWRFGWRVQNLATRPMKLLSARLPHGKFRSDEKHFDPPLELRPGEMALVEMPAVCDERPGNVIENAFVILSVEWQGDPYRIFVRLRVTINPRGEPRTSTELITTQRVGFSGLSS